MTIRARLVRWRWQAYVALTVLAALLLPATSEAGCLQASAPAPAEVSYSQASAHAPVVREAQQPADKPASRPRHAAICQHAHCGHPQVAPESNTKVALKRVPSPIHPFWAYDRLADGALIAEPERPPQA